MTDKRASMLLIGPRAIAADVLGGTKVSFEALVSYFQASDVWSTDIIDLSRRSGKSRAGRIVANVFAFFSVVHQVARRVSSSSLVFLNISSNGLLRAGPLIWLIASLSGKPIVIRVFGGDFAEQVENSATITRWLAKRTFLRADLLLFQTRALVEQFADSCHVDWLPTSRENLAGGHVRTVCHKLLFVSQLKLEKGLPEILAVVPQLAGSVSITIFGAAMPGFDPAVFDAIEKISYGGEVNHDAIVAAMQSHDVLLFPSYYDGEGYPGVIIEALQAGMPVIATRWKALPEIVEHELNGLLISPRSAEDLGTAITRLFEDQKLVSNLSAGALTSGQQYSASNINERLDKTLQSIAKIGESKSCVA